MGLEPTTLRLLGRVFFLLSYQGSSAGRALSLQHKAKSNPNTPCYGTDSTEKPSLINTCDRCSYVLCSAVDHFLRRYPSKVDIRKDDGYTPLHLAALNDHLDVVTSFAEQVNTDMVLLKCSLPYTPILPFLLLVFFTFRVKYFLSWQSVHMCE